MKHYTKKILFILAGIAFLFSLFGTEALARTKFVSIGTGGTGGVYYPYGGGVAEIWTKHVKGVRAVAEVTGASVENTKLCHKGETLFGEIMGDVGFQAYNGIGKFEGKPQDIRIMFMMYPSFYHVVALEKSRISSITGLKRKKVSVGAPGSGTEYMTNLVFQEALGIPYSSLNVFRLSFTESANALKDNTINAGMWCVAPPTSSIMDLATTHKINLIPFTKNQVAKISEKYPFYSGYTLPANTYNGQTEGVYGVSVWNIFICNADLDKKLVYNLTKAVFENQDYLVKIHQFGKYTTPQNTVEHSSFPLHPGTIQYLEEKGFTVPDKLKK